MSWPLTLMVLAMLACAMWLALGAGADTPGPSAVATLKPDTVQAAPTEWSAPSTPAHLRSPFGPTPVSAPAVEDDAAQGRTPQRHHANYPRHSGR